MRTSIVWCLVTLAAIAIAVAPMHASQQRPLPAFEVVAPDGAVVSGQQLSAEQRWLVLYVTPGCRSCDQILGSLKEWHTSQLASRLVIVVRASSEQTAEYIGSRLPAEASDVRWYADVNGGAWQALAISGTPVLLGVDAGEIKWVIGGVLNDPKALEPVVRSWVEY